MNWYRKGAEVGDADSMNNLGGMYEQGCGVPQDDNQAMNWYRQGCLMRAIPRA